jgi:hypothetical protein
MTAFELVLASIVSLFAIGMLCIVVLMYLNRDDSTKRLPEDDS